MSCCRLLISTRSASNPITCLSRIPPHIPQSAKCVHHPPVLLPTFVHNVPLRKTLRVQPPPTPMMTTTPSHTPLLTITYSLLPRVFVTPVQRRARSIVSTIRLFHRAPLLLLSLTASTHHATALACASATTCFLIISASPPRIFLSTFNPSADPGSVADAVPDEYPVGVTVAKGVPQGSAFQRVVCWIHDEIAA